MSFAHVPVWLVAPALPLALGLLCGCAPTAQETWPARAAEPDCSFRAATSCWTLGPRFPSPRAERSDSQPGRILRPPPAVLASKADSGRGPWSRNVGSDP